MQGLPFLNTGGISLKPDSSLAPQGSDLQELIDLSAQRAGSYTLLSRIWGAEVDEGLWTQLLAMHFPSTPQLPALDAAYRSLQRTIQSPTPPTLVDLRVDYARLCLGSDPRQGADPYESVHRNKEGLMMQDEWEAVLQLYSELGLKRSTATVESEDHLALELECLAQLCDRQETALRQRQFPEASWWVEQQVRMLDEHLLKWVPSFVRRVHKLGQTEFYKSFGDLTEAFLKADRDMLDAFFTR